MANLVNWDKIEEGRTPDEALDLAIALRKKFPNDLELANKDHELFMRVYGKDYGPGAFALPVAYYLTKKFLQQSPVHEAFGKSFIGGGLLDRPILDDDTTPASLKQMGSGLLGTYRSFFE